MAEAPNSEQFYPAQLVLLALGFLGPETAIVKDLGLDQDARGNIKADTKSYKTSMDNVWACGDARRGQSLIVWVSLLLLNCLRFMLLIHLPPHRVSKKVDSVLPASMLRSQATTLYPLQVRSSAESSSSLLPKWNLSLVSVPK